MYKYLVTFKSDNPHGVRQTIEVPSKDYDAGEAGVWIDKGKASVFYPWHRIYEVRMIEVN